jgi:TatD DNase family protein
MLHDAHCHVDQAPVPEALARDLEFRKIYTIAVTNLPSHYALAVSHLQGFRYVRPALGLHPLLAPKHEKELPAFERCARAADLIGEVGLDFSREGYATKDLQINSFRRVLACLSARPRFISVHSRGAEEAVLEELRAVSIAPAALHWFTGSAKACDAAVHDGHFFSINLTMLTSAKGKDLVRRMPKERILTESDFPHTRVERVKVGPLEIRRALNAIAELWQMGEEETASILQQNLQVLLKRD